MKYDDASWHYGGDFPNDLPDEAGATHIGMFVAWCLLNGLAGDMHIEEFPENHSTLLNREMTPGVWFIQACDQNFTDEDLSEEGNAFAVSYYEDDTPDGYVSDYAAMLGSRFESVYHVPDSWESFEILAPVIRKRYEEWKNLVIP